MVLDKKSVSVIIKSVWRLQLGETSADFTALSPGPYIWLVAKPHHHAAVKRGQSQSSKFDLYIQSKKIKNSVPILKLSKA